MPPRPIPGRFLADFCDFVQQIKDPAPVLRPGPGVMEFENVPECSGMFGNIQEFSGVPDAGSGSASSVRLPRSSSRI